MAGTVERKRVAILISGRGSNMMALVEAAQDPAFPAEIVLVASNRPDAAGLAWARDRGVATASVDHTIYGKDRAAFEAELQTVLDAHGADLLCLAGFMRLLTAEFTAAWEGRMINIHPALLPSFKGLDTHQRALDAGVRLHGATVHFVSSEMDGGAIIAQGAVPVLAGDTETDLASRVLSVEHRLYPQALALVASGRATLENGRTQYASDPTDASLSLLVPDA